ncbi:hypothetical protein ACFL5W_01950 [Thermodesulfobacteriota bacterium]
METFTEIKELVANRHFNAQKEKCLAGFADDLIDPPIVEIIQDLNKRSFCFTLQSCFGHFVYDGQRDPYNLTPLPITEHIDSVEYRIAYVAFCIENNADGERFLAALKDITAFDPENIQFGCAEWFWKRQVNSFALQVEPDRFKHQDKAMLDHEEALYIEKTRNQFFYQLKELLIKEPA